MKINSMGSYTTATEFVPLFPENRREFKPIEFRKVDHENKETKAQEPASGPGTETQSGIAPQDQQAASKTAEQADS